MTNLKKVWEYALEDNAWTWCGHAWTTTQVPSLVTALGIIFLGLETENRFLSYLVAVTLFALFYARREYKDEQAYRAKGTYRKSKGIITAAVDKAGDSLGPFTAFATVGTLGLLYWHPLLAIAFTVVTFIFLVIAMYDSAAWVEKAKKAEKKAASGWRR